jgi:hypothetical protein
MGYIAREKQCAYKVSAFHDDGLSGQMIANGLASAVMSRKA